jgi:CubicO group peptidase (beta-lactamase class C family)
VSELQALLEQGVSTGVFPTVRAEVWLKGVRVFSGGVGAEDTLFDLASLTKVMATTALFASLWEEGRVEPTTSLRARFPSSPAAGAELVDLLAHRSGLPAFWPLFERALTKEPQLLDRLPHAPARQAVRHQVVAAAAALPLERAPRQLAVYSDVGFILLGEALAHAGQGNLDALFRARVATPFELSAHFRPLDIPPEETRPVAPTDRQRPRAPAPGQNHSWKSLPHGDSLPGEVDDDNAWAMNGVAGHAGLFGTAGDVVRFGVRVLDELAGARRVASSDRWERIVTRDADTPGSTRALGFDTPSDQGSSAGQWLGKKAPGAFGHLGFTGTSLWVDRARQLVVALCSNRTFHGRENLQIQAFRPTFHDAVVESLGL